MRRKDREMTEVSEYLRVLNGAKIMRVAMFDGEYPYNVPVHYGYEYADGKLTLYMHGAKEGHKLDLLRENPNVCVEMDCDYKQLPGERACDFAALYISLIGRGRAEVLTDADEKIRGLKALMRLQTGRDYYIDAEMAAKVEVIRVDVEEFSVKSRKV